MTLALKNEWVWDSWYAKDGDMWHCYFLKADKALGDPHLRHFHVSQGHATSKNLIDWDYHGTCFAPAPAPAWDDMTTWTGSVIQDDDGLWHLFYTGGSQAEDGLYQRIGHAISTDMHNWQRVGNGLCLDMIGDNAKYYEKDHMVGFWSDRAMRDPWVIKDPNGNGWLMYFTARVPDESDPNMGGAVGFATSDDLYTWKLQTPVFQGLFGQLEVPQVFELNGRWYCLFCTADIHWSDTFMQNAGVTPVIGNHYLIGDSPTGCWQVAPGFMDGAIPCRRYAGRILHTDTGAVMMGFDDNWQNTFVGEITDPTPITADGDGYLSIAPATGNKG